MKKFLWVSAAVLAAALVLSGNMREKVCATFGGNVGFDDLSRSIEVSISQNPVAAMVFGMQNDDAVQVFASDGVKK